MWMNKGMWTNTELFDGESSLRRNDDVIVSCASHGVSTAYNIVFHHFFPELAVG